MEEIGCTAIDCLDNILVYKQCINLNLKQKKFDNLSDSVFCRNHLSKFYPENNKRTVKAHNRTFNNNSAKLHMIHFDYYNIE